MEIKINDRYTLTGSPAEMAILMILMDTPEIEEEQKKERAGQAPEQAPAPTPKKIRKAPTPDGTKAHHTGFTDDEWSAFCDDWSRTRERLGARIDD